MKKSSFSKQKTFVALCLAAICAFCAFFTTEKGKSAVAAVMQRQLPIYCVEKQDKSLSLTFDAAWGNEDTLQLIDILGKYGVKATFFVVGEWAEKYPSSVKALHDAGHEVMNHSNTHEHFTKLSSDMIIADINECNGCASGSFPRALRRL